MERKRNDKISVKEASVEDAKAQNMSDELEIVQMLGVDAGGKIDLERAVVMCWIFEKVPIGVERLM